MASELGSGEPPEGAFSYPNYRRYWLASVAMVFGVQFRFIAGPWLVYQLTDSPFWLGLPGIVSVVATVALTIPAGALADRVDNQRILVLGRGLTGLCHLLLASLTLAGAVTIWMVLAWSAVTGALSALTNPAQNAMLPRLIDRRAMASAVALASSVWNGTRIIGPAVAGMVIAFVGVGQALFVTAAGYAISTLLIVSLRLEPLSRAPGASEHGGMLAGIRYIVTQPIFFATIGLSFFASIFGRSYVVLLPIFADEILGAGVQGFGWLEAAAGVGGLLGTLAIIALRRLQDGPHIGAAMVGAAVIFGLWIAAFTASRDLVLSLLLLFGGAFFASIYLNLGMITLQLLVPDELRGRVMGVWGLTWFLGAAGGFISATLAELVGVPTAVAIGALAVSVFGAAMYALLPEVRSIPTLAEAASAQRA